MSLRQDQRRSFRPRVEALEGRTLLSVCTVDRFTDVGEGKELAGDLRYCIEQAQDEDSIQFAVKGTINLSRALPDLARSISIRGPGANLVTVRRDTGGDYRIFTITGSPSITVSGLTVSNGSTHNRNGGTGLYVAGGTATLSGLTISNNSSIHGYPGGGLYVAGGTVTLADSVVTNNEVRGYYEACGGGLYVGSGNVLVTNSTVSANMVLSNRDGFYPTEARGGGLCVEGGSVVVTNSTFSGNRAWGGNGLGDWAGGDGHGGGVWASRGLVTITHSTLSSNYAWGGDNEATYECSNGGDGEGGAVYVTYQVAINISHSTLSDNHAISGVGLPGKFCTGSRGNAWGGGLALYTGFANLRNTILAGNWAETAGPDLFGRLTSSGYNLIGNSQGGSGYEAADLLDVNPLLGPLRDNGGPTHTHALLPGSPALDAGDLTDAPEWDQRGEGYWRIAGKNIDIGAFEDQGEAVPGAGNPPGGVIAIGIDAGALRLLETPARRAWESPNQSLHLTGPA